MNGPAPNRREQILDGLGSVAGRLYGLMRPNADAERATIIVGIEARDEIAAAPRVIGLRRSAGDYLASKVRAAKLWEASDC